MPGIQRGVRRCSASSMTSWTFRNLTALYEGVAGTSLLFGALLVLIAYDSSALFLLSGLVLLIASILGLRGKILNQ